MEPNRFLGSDDKFASIVVSMYPPYGLRRFILNCFWALVAKWLPRWHHKVHFVPLWAPMASWLLDCHRRLILSYCGLCWQIGSQMISEDLFSAVLDYGGKLAPRWSQKGDFEMFWALVANLLPDGLRRLTLTVLGSGGKLVPM